MTSCLPELQLAESLKGNTSLKLLDIGGNNIGPEGIKVLLESLRGNQTLRNLELGYNPIGEEGAKHLADVIKYDLGVKAPSQMLPLHTDSHSQKAVKVDMVGAEKLLSQAGQHTIQFAGMWGLDMGTRSCLSLVQVLSMFRKVVKRRS